MLPRTDDAMTPYNPIAARSMDTNANPASSSALIRGWASGRASRSSIVLACHSVTIGFTSAVARRRAGSTDARGTDVRIANEPCQYDCFQGR